MFETNTNPTRSKEKKWQRSARHVSCTSSIGTLGYMARGFCYPVVNGGSDKELRIEFPNHLKVCGLFYVFCHQKLSENGHGIGQNATNHGHCFGF